MKVALASMVFPHPRRGVWPGIERHCGELARALVREGVSVTVLTTFRNGGGEEETWEGIRILRVHDSGSRWGRAGHLLNWHVRSFGRNLLRHLDTLRGFDALHAFVGLSSGAELARARIPLFASFPHRDRPANLVEALVQFGDYRTEKRFFPLARAVFAGSSEARRTLLEDYRLDPSKVHVVPLGVDGDLFRPPDPPRAPEGGPEGMRLLYVGPLVPRKGLRSLIEALPLVAGSGVRFTLALVGRGPEEDELRALAERLGVLERVRFAGYVAESDLVRWYQGSDLFVFPSLREGFGLVLVEAMACGLPVVATDVPPMPEVIGDAGLVVPPSDPGAMADAVVRLARDRALAVRLSESGRARVEREFLWSRVARQTLGHYEAARSAGAGGS